MSGLFDEPIKIRIPSQKIYNELLEDIARAFLGKRGLSTMEDARRYANDILTACTTGVRNGKIWKRAPGGKNDNWETILKKRLKVFGFDYDTRTLLPNNIEAQGTSDAQPKSSGSVAISKDEFIKNFVNNMIKQFPQLNTEADLALLRRLGYLSYLNERDIAEERVTNKLTDQIKVIAESLGITGKQRDVAANEKMSGTIADLVKIYQKTKEEYYAIETENLKEEVRLLLNSYERGELSRMMLDYYIKVLFGEKKTLDELKEFAEIK